MLARRGILLCVLVAAWCALTVQAAYGAANSGEPRIVCPLPPPGWVNPHNSTGEVFLGPLENPGDIQEDITCSYFQSAAHVLVDLAYALPTDLDPYGNFYYGCGLVQDVSWTSGGRQYRIYSRSEWATSGFEDSADQLGSIAAVHGFERVAQELLAASRDYAQGCALGHPHVEVAWQFSFEFQIVRSGFSASGGVGVHGVAGLGNGRFETGSLIKQHHNVLPVTSINAPDVPVSIESNGHRYTVVLRLVRGIYFRYRTVAGGATTASLNVALRVIHSSYAACRVGAAGTATISDSDSGFRLRICGSLFSGGVEKASAVIDAA